jgi:hypothetical protein
MRVPSRRPRSRPLSSSPHSRHPRPSFSCRRPKAAGTELSIPGIGSVGTLPKLDFGLDLLYGAGSDPVQERAPENEKGDVTIKGTIKHRF